MTALYRPLVREVLVDGETLVLGLGMGSGTLAGEVVLHVRRKGQRRGRWLNVSQWLRDNGRAGSHTTPIGSGDLFAARGGR